MERVIKKVRATVTVIPFRYAVLFKINRKEVYIKPKKPFDTRIENNT